jgi:hypothetical protein
VAPASSVSGEPGGTCRVVRRAGPNEYYDFQKLDKLTCQRATTFGCHSLIAQCKPAVLVENRTDGDGVG